MGIELKNVSKRVGRETHIYPTDLQLEMGGFNVLIGTTLAGKTTMLRLMAGLEKPSSGEIWFDGKNVTGIPVQQRNISMVYQQFINYPNLTVYENIASPLKVGGVSRTETKQRVDRIAQLLRLGPMLERMPNELSGGQQQRTALARALVKSADLVLLDEPLANLDYKLREELRDELPKLFSDTGATVVYATTEPLEALLLGGHIATLHEGRVTQYGITPEVYRQPKDLLSARVFSDPPINVAQVRKSGGEFRLPNGAGWAAPARYRGLADGSYSIGFRPHHINLAPIGENPVKVAGSVVITEISGSESTLHVDIGDDTWISLSQGIHRFDVGDRAELFLQSDRCLYFDSDGRTLDG